MSNGIERRSAQAYPHQLILNTRFTETDANNHINNVSYLLYYEDAQAQFLVDSFPELAEPGSWRFLQVRCDVSYDGQSHYPDPVTVATGIDHVDDCWLRLSQALFQRGQCVGRCDAILLKVDAQERPAAIDAAQRAELERHNLDR